MFIKKLIIILILSSVTTVFADDLIVDKSSHSQYQTENLLRFDPFDSNNIFEDNYFSAKLTNDTIDVSNKGIVLGSTFTQEVWISPSQKGKKDQLLIGDIFSESKNRPPTIWLSDYGKTIMYGFGTGSSYYSTTVDSVISTPGWYHVATTFDGTNYKLFLNGEEVWSTTRNRNLIPANTSIKTIGVNFVGAMDALRLWDVDRTESAIKSDMNHRLTESETNLVA